MATCINQKKLNKKEVQCLTCHHSCKIEEGKVGVCGIRKNVKGELQLLTYGKTIAVNIDPIEKKPLFHFLPGSKAFSLGTVGCNFRCANCQNFDISQMFESKGKVEKYVRMNWGIDMPPETIVQQALENNCASIAYTYNEPTTWTEYGLDIMKLAKKEGLKNVWVSNGFMSDETIELILPYLDAINVDIKSFDKKFYRSNCGALLQPILDNCILFAREDSVWLEVTTLVIPTLSDDEEMLKKLAQFIKKKLGDHVPWHVSAFSGSISWKLQKIPDTPVESIQKAYEIGKNTGLKYVYAGNVWNPELESTHCPKCNEVVIGRTAYMVNDSLEDGRCPECGEEIEGIY
jgi:pyruvate formate lyase activating enzyme